MKTLFINIKELLQVREQAPFFVSGKEMNVLPKIENAFLLIEDDTIKDFGLMKDCPKIIDATVINATGCVILPTWVDSHTHIVFAGNRVQEFVDRINGLSYEEIATRGGGILNSAKKLNATTDEALYEQSKERLKQVMKLGTGAIEIKSGYGLTVEGELKMLRVIKKLKENFPISVKATFLGAHAFPEMYKQNKDAYVDLIINEMLPKINEEKSADFIDVFLETGYFSIEQAEKIMIAGNKIGLQSKIHVNQFTSFGGIKACIANNALSVDHLEIITDEDLQELKNSKTMPVALPSCSFFISIPYTPARKIIESGLPLAIASDYNPGTSPSGDMNFVVASACIKMKMTPEEAINAATINGAYAMGIHLTHGSITRGKNASLIITKPIETYHQIPYEFTNNFIDRIMIAGVFI